jgi:putative transcriptional regulator
LGIGGLAISIIGLARCAQAEDLAVGDLLVATEKSHDPDFTHSVVALTQYDRESAVGLMLGKPTDIPITDLLPEAKGRLVVVYAGGPLAIGVRGLVRTKSVPYFRVVTERAELLRLIARGMPASEFRVYAGYVGWTAQQLQSEVARGLWRVEAADAKTIFGAVH